MTRAPARLLIIAGSDSSGGAGIQADIKTATALGVYAMTAVTAITVQDTTCVHAIHRIPASLVRDQIACVLADIGADAIKIGMLGTAQTVEAVADFLKQNGSSIPVIVDPVLTSTSGVPLLEKKGIASLKSRLLPLSALVTPNIPEAENLTGITIDGGADMRRAAERLRALGAKAVLIKGGHATGSRVRDLLVTGEGAEIYERRRLPTRSTHGTGCTLATAIACGIAQGLPLAAAIRRARNFVQDALETALNFGQRPRLLNHMNGRSN